MDRLTPLSSRYYAAVDRVESICARYVPYERFPTWYLTLCGLTPQKALRQDAHVVTQIGCGLGALLGIYGLRKGYQYLSARIFQHDLQQYDEHDMRCSWVIVEDILRKKTSIGAVRDAVGYFTLKQQHDLEGIGAFSERNSADEVQHYEGSAFHRWLLPTRSVANKSIDNYASNFMAVAKVQERFINLAQVRLYVATRAVHLLKAIQTGYLGRVVEAEVHDLFAQAQKRIDDFNVPDQVKQDRRLQVNRWHESRLKTAEEDLKKMDTFCQVRMRTLLYDIKNCSGSSGQKAPGALNDINTDACTFGHEPFVWSTDGNWHMVPGNRVQWCDAKLGWQSL